MRKILTASKDTSIYEAYSTNNAGLDEILEIGKVLDTNIESPSSELYASSSVRSLIYFDLPTSATIPNTAKYFLNLKLANATDLFKNQQVVIYSVSKSWDEGSGYFYQTPYNANDGATWKRSEQSVSWSLAGGDFITSSTSASTTISSYPVKDLRVEVTDILKPIVSQSLQNTFYGLVVKFPIADEQDKENKGNIKFFSTQTHTIHQPTLEIAWDDQSFITGTLQPVPSGINVKVTPSNIPSHFAKNDVAKISLVVRDQYPLKSFDSVLRYKNKYYLPSSSYYSIIDSQANTVVVPFDEYSKINCDTSGSYIILDTSPLYSGRYYELKLRIVQGSYIKTIDAETQFTITDSSQTSL